MLEWSEILLNEILTSFLFLSTFSFSHDKPVSKNGLCVHLRSDVSAQSGRMYVPVYEGPLEEKAEKFC